MEKREFSGRKILAGKAPQDAPVTIKGWVRTRRDSKAGISFVHISDGSAFHPVQVVAPNTLPNYESEVLKLTAGCAVEAMGMIVPSPAKGQPFEMQANALRVIGWVDDPDTYPIQPKPHTLEYLREVAHLRPRTNVVGAATRVRHTLAKAIHRFFDENGFFWVNTPIITASDAEGAGALFRVSTLDLANLPRTPDGNRSFARSSLARRRRSRGRPLPAPRHGGVLSPAPGSDCISKVGTLRTLISPVNRLRIPLSSRTGHITPGRRAAAQVRRVLCGFAYSERSLSRISPALTPSTSASASTGSAPCRAMAFDQLV
jgi:hypothetical protein